MNNAIATIDLSELLRQQPTGEPVNTHVVEASREPRPDFEAMRKLVHDNEQLIKGQDAAHPATEG